MRKLLLLCLLVVFVGGGALYVLGKWPFGITVSTKRQRYHCPMHPQYISDSPGDCPICGMRLVPIEDGDTAEPQGTAAGHEGHLHAASSPAASAAEKKVLYYIDPMEPTVHYDKPGRSPMGMELVPVYADEGTEPSEVPGYATVRISPEQQSMMGVVLDQAKVIDLDRSILAVGRVTYDETRLHHIHTRFEGYIEVLYVNFVGQPVKADEPLFSVYSPELLVTENEYVLALESGQKQLMESAKRRLALWNIPPEEITRLEKSRKPSKAIVIRSPINGFVTAKTALHGMRIMPQDNVYDIADLSMVWVVADIYEMDLPFVKVGQPAEISLVAEPGKVREANIAYIYPTVDPMTRTVKARFDLDNAAGDLKPDMFANVRIKSNLGRGLAVPESAVLSTGERKIVFVAREGSVFEPREVETGVKVPGFYQILRGVSAGESVVVGANFLLDSESKLKASISDGGGHIH